jgi:regulation of enolase protein 1 (concanavalin A-like superfamily)
MQWLNPPAAWEANGDTLVVTASPRTDFWRKTHYGFIRDNGHFYHQEVAGDFEAEVEVRGDYRTLYDQAGLMVRVDEATWVKCGVELVDGVQQASVVVTRDYSDWSVVPLPANPPTTRVRVVRRGQDIEVHHSLGGETWVPIRTAHLPAAGEAVSVGMMCASPDGDGFRASFTGYTVRPL